MKAIIPLFVLGSLLCAPLTRAQNASPVDDWKPASSNQPGKDYPKVNSEGRVKFRIVAPEAQTVGVTFRESSEFTKGEDGAWYGHTRPLDEGFHYCLLKMDGAEVPDPNSRMFFGAQRWGSAVEVPAKDQDTYTLYGAVGYSNFRGTIGGRTCSSARACSDSRPTVPNCNSSTSSTTTLGASARTPTATPSDRPPTATPPSTATCRPTC